MTLTELALHRTPSDLELIYSYWRAVNYLSVGQIYLLGHPLLPEHVKPACSSHTQLTARLRSDPEVGDGVLRIDGPEDEDLI